MTLELTPRSLGRITMNCQMSGKEMSLELVTETASSRAVLSEHFQALRDVVQNSGYSLSQLDVRSRQEGADPRRPQRPPDRGRGRGIRSAGRDELAGVSGVANGAPAWRGGRENGVWLVA